ncbi:MAG: hypothetical protein UT61_C0035G0005 [Candidatus Woesebacteria bacterium GW2011_GWA1_39_8]|uniref:Uncharacterized protein n=1 Tax=Candidatus Woesebacteria bacterium GW2011_GWA1_39_8 TaxID=1618552 RepID=A0A0G0S3F4_9BACT|nr:MAG: hypothetical protein UT61_C0035G0005 [Candidatus Woesebacteria bacterium GW2011_GWA1_39_8]
MTPITIPKKIVQNDDLVIIPKMEYEFLLRRNNTNETEMNPTLKNALKRAKRNLKLGKLMSYEEVGRKLGFKN